MLIIFTFTFIVKICLTLIKKASPWENDFLTFKKEEDRGYVACWRLKSSAPSQGLVKATDLDVDGDPIGSVCCGCDEQIHRDCRSPVEKKGRQGHSEWERQGPNLCLDWLLLLFWAHYMENGPHSLCTGCFRWLPFTDNKGEEVANYYREKGYLQMQRKKWSNWLHFVFERFGIHFRKLL